MNTQEAHTLIQRWTDLRQQEPHIRARQAATRLGVSEGELVAARLTTPSVQRLVLSHRPLLEALIHVGEVLTITRNEDAVHEKRGYYSHLKLSEHGGGAFDANINLRFFFRHWQHAFAVTDETAYGERKSIQIFDSNGTSVHKIYRTDNSDPDAWDKLIKDFTDREQDPTFTAQTPNAPYTPQSPAKVDRAALMQQWRAITDIHTFWFMLREHRLTRIDALRLADPDLARPVAADTWRDVVQQAATSGLPIMVFTRSPGTAQIHSGPVHKISEKNGWFNVLDPTFNWHLRADAVHEAWVVYKPTASGGQTSLELYNAKDELISHLYGAVNLEAPELRGWRRLLHQFPTLTTGGA